MSCRVDTSSLIAGACIVSLYDGLGITGAALRSVTGAGGSGAGLLYNDWDTGDDAKEFRALLVTAPSSGVLTLNEDGSFSLIGAADGSYSLTYRLFVDGADLGTAAAGITVGAAASFTVNAAGQPSSLAFGAATFNVVVQFSVNAPGQASALAYGAAAFVVDGSFVITPAGLPSTLAFGQARMQFDGSYVPDPTNARRLVITIDPRLQGTSLPGSGGPLLQPYPFAPGSHLDIEWDWRPWMDTGDALDSFSVDWDGAAIGTLSGSAEGLGVVRTWLTVPPDAAEGVRGLLLCTVSTFEGRIDVRKYEVMVKQL